MLNWIIDFSLRNRFLVLLCVGVAAVYYNLAGAVHVNIYRAFEDGTVEINRLLAANTTTWKPTEK